MAGHTLLKMASFHDCTLVGAPFSVACVARRTPAAPCAGAVCCHWTAKGWCRYDASCLGREPCCCKIVVRAVGRFHVGDTLPVLSGYLPLPCSRMSHWNVRSRIGPNPLEPNRFFHCSPLPISRTAAVVPQSPSHLVLEVTRRTSRGVHRHLTNFCDPIKPSGLCAVRCCRRCLLTSRLAAAGAAKGAATGDAAAMAAGRARAALIFRPPQQTKSGKHGGAQSASCARFAPGRRTGTPQRLSLVSLSSSLRSCLRPNWRSVKMMMLRRHRRPW